MSSPLEYNIYKRRIFSVLFTHFNSGKKKRGGPNTISTPLKMAHRDSSSQEGGISRNVSLPRTTKKSITTNLKTMNNQNCPKMKLHGSLTTKELKEHSSRLVGGEELGSQDRQDKWQGGEPVGEAGAG